MRTTLNVDEELLQRLRSEAERTKTPFRSVLNRALRLGLERLRPESAASEYRSPAFSMGVPDTVNLDKALALAAHLDDEATVLKHSGNSESC